MTSTTETLSDLLDLRADLPYRELAERAGVGLSTLREWRCGLVRVPHRRTRIRLAKALGVGLERLDAALAETRKQRR